MWHKTMWRSLINIYHLGIKELWSLRSDVVMCVLIVLSFTVFIVIPTKNAVVDMRNASVAVVDEDNTPLSRALFFSLQEPYFKKPALVSGDEAMARLDDNTYTFVVWIPRRFEADINAQRKPAIQVLVDATAMTQAGNGAGYISQILGETLKQYFPQAQFPQPVTMDIRVAFNPNLYGGWFFGITNMISIVSMLAIVLTGAALIRERERGTVEHLLVMPLRPLEIALGKVWANSLVILIAMFFCIQCVVKWFLDIPLQGSLTLFLVGSALYLFAISAIGIFLGTVARSMPQLGLLFLPIVMSIAVLSGGLTPLDVMPKPIHYFMLLIPSSHFTNFAMAVLFRGAGFTLVWQQIAAMIVIGVCFLTGALLRFRGVIGKQ
ncbi:MAG TPA: ABC transporter permease [Pseudomonadales bacterium]|jgi:ABC-2 type transport system permease protein|nr:ABC transporter permease [Pseudomonadales bacterium]